MRSVPFATLCTFILLCPFEEIISKEQEVIGTFDGLSAVIHSRHGVTGLIVIAGGDEPEKDEIKKFQKYGFDVLALNRKEEVSNVTENTFINYLAAASSLQDYTRKIVIIEGRSIPFLRKYLTIYDNRFSGYVFLLPHSEIVKKYPTETGKNPLSNSTLLILEKEREALSGSINVLKKQMPETGIYTGLIDLPADAEKVSYETLLGNHQFINYLYFTRYRIVWTPARDTFPHGCSESFHGQFVIPLDEGFASGKEEDGFCPQFILTREFKLYRVENAIDNECLYNDGEKKRMIACSKRGG